MQIYLSHFSPSRLIHLLAVVMFFSGTTRVHEHLCDIPLQPRFPQGAATPFHNAVTQMGLSLQCQLFCLHICNHTHRGSCHHPGVSVEVEHWLLLLFYNILSHLDDLHFCKLARFNFFSSFCNLSWTPDSSLLPPMLSHNTTGPISEQGILPLIVW